MNVSKPIHQAWRNFRQEFRSLDSKQHNLCWSPSERDSTYLSWCSRATTSDRADLLDCLTTAMMSSCWEVFEVTAEDRLASDPMRSVLSAVNCMRLLCMRSRSSLRHFRLIRCREPAGCRCACLPSRCWLSVTLPGASTPAPTQTWF